MKKAAETIPQQQAGSSSDTTYSIEASSTDEAVRLYNKAKNNLLNVNKWKDLAGFGTTEFHLTDKDGNALTGTVKKGDYFRINLPFPGTGNPDSKGSDWVKVEEIDEGHIDGVSDWITIKVRPVEQPQEHSEEVTHFFSKKATSNFFVKRQGHKVTAAVYGRNEIANVKVTNFWSKMRNAIIGVAGMIGFNKPQWLRLVRGF